MKENLVEKYLCEKEMLNQKDILYKSQKGKDGNFFVVIKRNTRGMPGPQDPYSMYAVNSKNEIVKNWGSHPSFSGAQGFGANKGYPKGK